MYRFGIIGAGIISGRHVAAVNSRSDAKVVAIADIVIERAEKFATDGATAFSDYKEMISCVELDAVIINLPHSLHEECAVFCANKGINVFVEKPLEVSSDKSKKIIEACKNNNVVLQVGHVQGFFPENIMAQEYIKNEKLGKLVMINDVRTSFYFAENRPEWFLKKELSGGGIMMNFGAHSLDKVLFLTESTIKYITGSYTCFSTISDVDGSAQLFLTTESGISASINLCGYSKNNENTTMLYFTNGVLRLKTGTSLELLTDNGFEKICDSSIEVTFKNQLDAFIHAVSKGKNPKVDGAYGLHIIESLEKVYEQN